MNYTTYFEIGGRVVECVTPCPSILPSVPPVVKQVEKQPVRAVRNGQAKRSRAASPKAIYQPAYTVGVGYGNPLFWLVSASLIKGAQILQPETITAY